MAVGARIRCRTRRVQGSPEPDPDLARQREVVDVAGHTATFSKLSPFVRPARVNGAAGAVVAPHGRLFSVMAFTVSNGKITQIDALLDPERLARLDLSIPPIADERY
jgi:RNA polymerase sigma-70 factor (ECF subfamily)